MGIARTASFAVGLVIGFAVAVSPAPGASQGPWVQPAADLSATGQDAADPQVTTAPDGTVTAVWRRNDGSDEIIQAATRPPGGSFGAPDDLSAVGLSSFDPQIATVPDGTTTAVWQGFNGSYGVIQAATRPPGASFGAPVDLSVAGLHAQNPQISAGPDGTTTVIWIRKNGSNFIVQAATRPPGGFFGSPVDLSGIGKDAFDPEITTAPDGTTTVVWRRNNGSNYIIQAAARPPGGSFGAPVDLSAIGQSAANPQITTAPDGTATVAWFRFNGSNNIIQAATRPPGGSFGAPVDLSATGQSAGNPQITTAPDGTVTAVWRHYNPTFQIVQAATRPPGGPFGAPVDLSAPSPFALGPEVTAASDGSATAVWQRYNGSNDIIQTISTARPSLILGVAKEGAGGGTVSSIPAGIVCGSDCAETYPSYTSVTLAARAASGSRFTGWGGACEDAIGNTCELTMLDDANATASFGKPKLKVIKVKPKKPNVKRSRKVKLRVTGKNKGDAAAKKARLCLKLTKKVKKELKPKGKTCQKLGKLGPGKAKTKAFKLKATSEAKKGKSYKVNFKLAAKGAKASVRAVKVKVR